MLPQQPLPQPLHPQSRTSDLPGWPVGSRSELLIGGRFQLLDEIGIGVTAIVYKARDTVSGEVVALKVLKGSAAIHPRLSANFKREAEIGETIRHPNIVRIHDCGVHGTWIYLVMEYLNGRTLAEILSLSPHMSMAEFEALCRQLLDGLDCVHANGIVHRDLKPANLMLTQGGVWKLMDFGIARRVTANVTAGPALGTPDYMSPEQLVGEAATPASDLFTAGVLFYEALTGKLPFRDWKLVERCTKVAPRVRELRPGVPAWLDEMVARCLMNKPEARWSSALDMLAALATFEESATPVQPAPQHPTVAAATAHQEPRIENAQPLADLLTDNPGNPEVVLGRLLDLLHLLHQRSAQGCRHEPVTPLTIHIASSGAVGLWAQNASGSKDTMTFENPKYASPEMLRGRGISTQDERTQSDLYCAGFVFFELLVGRKLFRSEFTALEQDASGLGWMEWHSDASKALRPASALVPALPAAVSELIASMTAKDASRRCASYVECIRAVQNILHRVESTRQIQVPPQGLGGADPRLQNTPPAAVRAKSNRSRILAIAAVAVAVLTALATVAWQLLSRS